MSRRVSTCILAVCVMSCSAAAQTRPTLTLLPTGSTRVSPGGVVEVEVILDNLADPILRGYQTEIQIVPLAGSTGSVSLASVTDPIFIDRTRTDFIFFGLSAIADVSEILFRLGGLVEDSEESQSATTPKYLGTYLLQASATAEGDFRVEFVHPSDADASSTFLFHRDNPDIVIPFDPISTTLTVALQPENDDCANAAVATNGTTPFSTENTTTDGLPLAGTCDEGGGTALEEDVWFNYTATCTGILTVSTCNQADFDTRIAVYGDNTATCTCPTSNTTLLACDDNAAGCGGTSRLTLNVNQGSCYKIRVGGAGVGVNGTGDLTITCVGNDTCAAAQAAGTPSTTAGATVGATTDSGLPTCGPAQTSPGVWFTVNGTGGLMTASLCSAASYDTRLTVFQGNCGTLTCVANANDTCGNRESISWCSSAGAVYKVLVSGNSGLSGTFTLSISSQSCNDNNACTNDTCSGAQCVNTVNYDNVVSCCTPATGVLCTINDTNPCTADSCNSSTGACIHTPVANRPEPACDDGLTCTFDQCISGACGHPDINTIPCTGDPDCPNENFCNTDAGFCICVPAPTIELVAQPGTLPVASCYSADDGDLIQVRIEMGFAPPQEPIIGGQFFLAYDPLTLDFINIEPGGTVDPGSPFTLEFAESVNEVAGTIDYGVLVDFGEQGTSAASTLAVITFQAVAECDPFVVFRPSGPNGLPNRLTAAGGVEVLPDELIDLPPISTNGSPPVMSGCPADSLTPTDPGQFQSQVTWTLPTATDSCDGANTVTCNPPSGSGFPIGTTTVTCSTTNSCGLPASCSFDVTVQPATLTVDVQISPTMAPGPFDRCITFDLWDCSAPAPGNHVTVAQTISFASGLATGVTIPIPGGQWECLTARDRLHTLRSTAADFATTNGTDFTGTFVGDRASGGHWLVSGNLNDDPFIDILDFAVFMNKFLSPANPNTPCGTAAPDANINGDNVVDLVDFVFVQVNSFMANEPNCCGAPGVAAVEEPLTRISVRDLRRRGLFHLRFADLNHDGWLDSADIAAFLDGERPPAAYEGPKRTRTGGLRDRTPSGQDD